MLRPFDRQRSGFVMGEGSGIVILEERGRALARGAKIYGELVGYGLSGDAFHITAPPEDGNGARLAMKQAFRNLDVQNVSYINAHATSTPLGDRAEMSAITSIFSNQLKTIPISSIKGSTGHLLGKIF
jgi:3-oxoacyl-[acyl-carrier-protein] synthase II